MSIKLALKLAYKKGVIKELQMNYKRIIIIYKNGKKAH